MFFVPIHRWFSNYQVRQPNKRLVYLCTDMRKSAHFWRGNPDEERNNLFSSLNSLFFPPYHPRSREDDVNLVNMVNKLYLEVGKGGTEWGVLLINLKVDKI